jgi:hypothetical protein
MVAWRLSISKRLFSLPRSFANSQPMSSSALLERDFGDHTPVAVLRFSGSERLSEKVVDIS